RYFYIDFLCKTQDSQRIRVPIEKHGCVGNAWLIHTLIPNVVHNRAWWRMPLAWRRSNRWVLPGQIQERPESHVATGRCSQAEPGSREKRDFPNQSGRISAA